MFTSFFLIKWIRRSRGPSNESSFTEYASGADSKSEDDGGNSLIYRRSAWRPARAPSFQPPSAARAPNPRRGSHESAAAAKQVLGAARASARASHSALSQA